MKTGEIEIVADAVKVLNRCSVSLPFHIHNFHEVSCLLTSSYLAAVGKIPISLFSLFCNILFSVCKKWKGNSNSRNFVRWFRKHSRKLIEHLPFYLCEYKLTSDFEFWLDWLTWVSCWTAAVYTCVGGVMVACWIGERNVTGFTLTHCPVHSQVTTLGKLFTHMCLCSPCSTPRPIIWYQSKGCDALWLGR